MIHLIVGSLTVFILNIGGSMCIQNDYNFVGVFSQSCLSNFTNMNRYKSYIQNLQIEKLINVKPGRRMLH